MGCGSCSSGGGCGTTGGCKSNGGCSTGGCNRLNSYDWLTGLDDAYLSNENVPTLEIRFKGGRKEFYSNTTRLELFTGDSVVVETATGLDLGFVSLQGQLVQLQMKKKEFKSADPLPVISRKSSEQDLVKYEQIKARELPTLYRSRQIINDLKVNMKLSDVEFQFDNKKATFFYSAEDRVDFRELIKMLATEFKVRIEMKQISLRQEAGRLGGIGVCGRELCCSTWLTDFKSVNTSAARYQNLSINPQKLSGQCGRLKCCLNYELETYMDALRDIPTIETSVQTKLGDAKLQKTDIFKKMMWFSIPGVEGEWIKVSTEEVAKIIELNKKGIKPNTLDASDLLDKQDARIPVRLNSNMKRLDDKYRHKNKPKNDKNRGPKK